MQIYVNLRDHVSSHLMVFSPIHIHYQLFLFKSYRRECMDFLFLYCNVLKINYIKYSLDAQNTPNLYCESVFKGAQRPFGIILLLGVLLYFCSYVSIVEVQEFQICPVLSLLRLGISHFSRDMRLFLIDNDNQTQSMFRHTQWSVRTVALKHSDLGASPAAVTRASLLSDMFADM